jgi:hypothetical protein
MHSQTSSDFGKTWNTIIPNENLIFVITPGSGSYQNREAYSHLKKLGYKLEFIGSSIREPCDRYPEDWGDNQLLDLSVYKTENLATLSNKFMERLTRVGTPSLVICGSRGGQVTIGLVWRHFWRGPTIVINAGCLTSNTLIPKGVYPVMITMDRDYFGTKNYKFVKIQFEKLSRVRGVQVHLKNEGHVPRTETLKSILALIVPQASLWQVSTLEEHKDFKIEELGGKEIHSSAPIKISVSPKKKELDCPLGKILTPQGRCINDTNRNRHNHGYSILARRLVKAACPPGTERSPVTKRCIKSCSPTQRRHPQTQRCRKLT